MTHPSITARSHPDKLAVVMAGSGAHLSFAELVARANQGTHLMRALGLKPGDHLAVLMENNLRFFEVKAVVQPVSMAEAGPALEAELIAFCRERLAALKCPKSIDFEAQLPRQDNGKLYKRLLRDRYWAGRTSRVI